MPPTASATSASTVSFTPDSPPAQTTVSHTIDIAALSGNASTPVTISFADEYDGHVTLSGLTPQGNSTELTGRVIDDDGDGATEAVVLEPTAQNGTLRRVSVTVTLRHPPARSERSFRLTVRRAGGLSDSVPYTVQPIGPNRRSGPTGAFDQRRGAGFVYDGATVFRGEGDIEFRGALSSSLLGTQGTAEGVPVSTPIPADHPTGVYSVDGTNRTANLTIANPRVTTFEVRNPNGEKINGGVEPFSENLTLTVVAKSNFASAEQLSLTVTDNRGTELTNELTSRPTRAEGSDGTVAWRLRFGDEAAETYRITVEGSDDLTTGKARRSTTVDLSTTDATISVRRPIVSRGDTATISYDGARKGSTRVVTIDDTALRDDLSPSVLGKTFRDVEHVSEVGYVTRDGQVVTRTSTVSATDIAGVYAEVTVDSNDGSEVLQIDTGTTTGQRVPLLLHERGTSPAAAVSGENVSDSVELFITETQVQLTTPQTYVPTTETTLSGTTTPGIEHIAIYVRDDDEYRLVDLDGENQQITSEISVSDGSFTRKDVTLSAGDAPGNDLLSFPGSYRLGVVVTDQFAGPPPRVLTDSRVVELPSTQHPLRVVEANLSGEARVRQNQLPVSASTVTVSGTAVGPDAVGIAIVGSRGQIEYTRASVNDSQQFSAELPVDSFARGRVTTILIGPGRDGRLGNGVLEIGGRTPNATLRDLKVIESRSGDITQTQAEQLLIQDTATETASDDTLHTDLFRITDPSLSITNITLNTSTASQTPTQLTVTGTTNVKPDGERIFVSLRQNGLERRDQRVETWGRTWSASVNTTTLSAGNYTVRVRIRDVVDYASVSIGARSQAQTQAQAQVQADASSNAVSQTPVTTQTSAPVTPRDTPQTASDPPTASSARQISPRPTVSPTGAVTSRPLVPVGLLTIVLTAIAFVGWRSQRT